MKKLAALLVTLVVAACGSDGSPTNLNKPAPQSVSDLPECRNIHSAIVGHVATIYQAAAPEADFFILVVDDDPTCATDEQGVNESGVIPGNEPVEATKCPICDGNPQPSVRFPGLL